MPPVVALLNLGVHDVELSVVIEVFRGEEVVGSSECTFVGGWNVEPPSCAAVSDWFREPGEYGVRLRYVAVDGIAEGVSTTFRAEGDEAEILVGGYADGDLSVPELRVRILRRAPPEIRLVDGGESETDLPAMTLVNGSAAPIWVEEQDGHALGYVVRVAPSGAWEDAGHIGSTCGTGVFPLWIDAGGDMPAGEIYAIGGADPLPPGRYLYVVEYGEGAPGPTPRELPSRRGSATRAVLRELGIVEGTAAPADPVPHDPPEPDHFAAIEVLPRPGEDRPDGTAGAETAPRAVRVGDGDVLSGTVSATRSRHYYSVDARPGDVVFLRLYARGAQLWVDSGDAAGLEEGNGGGELHRAWPAWSTRDREFPVYEPDHTLLLMECDTLCGDRETEFYGRVHVVRGTPD